MIEASTLLLFCVAVMALLISPGPNMAFLFSHSLSDGAKGGLAVALGISVADLVLTALTATGVTAVITAWPPSFDLLRYLGALYLLWLAVQALRQRAAVRLEDQGKIGVSTIFRAAMLNSLLNPKALLFFMVFLPQFVNPERGSIPVQIAILGIVLSTIALVFHALLAITGSRIGALFERSSARGNYFGWLHARLFVGAGSATVAA